MNSRKLFNDLFMLAMFVGLMSVPFSVFGLFNYRVNSTPALSSETQVLSETSNRSEGTLDLTVPANTLPSNSPSDYEVFKEVSDESTQSISNINLLEDKALESSQ